MSEVIDTSYHRRRVAALRKDPQYSAEYELARREIEQVNAVMRVLDELRRQMRMSKAELAREIGRNDAVVRRLFTAQSNPELRTVAAIADALGAEIRIEPRARVRQRRVAERTEPPDAPGRG